MRLSTLYLDFIGLSGPRLDIIAGRLILQVRFTQAIVAVKGILLEGP